VPARASAIDFRRTLRLRSTDAEQQLWRLLRAKRLAGFKFRRQHTVGPYVLDFLCHAENLAVEADGGQHFSEEGQARDRARDEYLARRGIRVMRFTDRQVLAETEWVVEDIWRALRGTGGT
jgi:very-short-patch-repair endonuclease